jgi:hypothetical protein
MHPPAIYLHGSKFVQTRRFHLLLGVLSITAILHAEDLTPTHPLTDGDTYIPGSLEVAPFVPPASSNGRRGYHGARRWKSKKLNFPYE